MPKNKKATSSSSDSDPGPEDRNPPASKKVKPTETKKPSGGNSEEKQWVLEKMRMVRINEFRGKRSVDIREHYEKDGAILPGKRGIALSGMQWRKLLEHADEITKALEE